MADSKQPEGEHDEVAEALARLAGGDVAPSEHEPPAPIIPVVPVRKTVRPASTRPVGIKPAAAAAIPAVAAPKAATPAVPALAVPPPAGGRPVRPAAPVLSSGLQAAQNQATAPASPPVAGAPAQPVLGHRPVAPAQMIRKQRPSAPTLGSATLNPNDTEIDGNQLTGLSNQMQGAEVIDDDDAVIVPAPDASVFIPRQKPVTSAEARAAVQRKKSLDYRRTLIPILLTSGTLMFAFGILKFLAGGDSTLQYLPSWIPVTLMCVGLLVLGVAGINMMSVKGQLAAIKSES